MDRIFRDFIKQKLVIPFGRVIQGGLLKSPYNETMVGRKKQRKYLIRWLLEPKKNGCVLVTGTRGSGKTSFVNHCIAEHNLNVYSRITQNTVFLKLGDRFIIFLILLLSAFLLEIFLNILFVDTDVLLSIVLFVLGMFPFLVMATYAGMLSNALKNICQQYGTDKSESKEENSYTRETEPKGDVSYKEETKVFKWWLELKVKTFKRIVMLVFLLKGFWQLSNDFWAQSEPSFLLFLECLILLLICGSCLKYIYKRNKIKEDKIKSDEALKFKKKWLNSSFIIIHIIAIINIYVLLSLISSYWLFSFATCIISYFDFYFIAVFYLYMNFGYYIENKTIKFFLDTSVGRTVNDKQIIYASHLTQWSFPMTILRHYIPSIVISINLGFKNLEHSNIIHAMLIELRDKYKEIFLGRNYTYNKIIPVFILVISMITWNKFSQSDVMLASGPASNEFIKDNVVNINFINYSSHSDIPVHKTKLEKVLDQKLISGSIRNDRKIIAFLLKKDKDMDKELASSKHYYFKYEVGDVLAIVFIFFLLYLPILLKPFSFHRRNIKLIEKLLRDLSSRVTQTNKSIIGNMNKVVSSVLGSGEKSIQREPLNSRIAEMRMINLLSEIRVDQKSWFLSPGKIFTIASPSLVFVFDELDKLHNHSGLENQLEVLDKQKSYTENEAARANQINMLLSDMKNFITIAKAKFIFVAGRDLHDQWLADANSREAFLTSIFDIELFIPSLLTDHERPLTDINNNIVKYLNLQYKRAIHDKHPFRYRRQQISNNLLSEKEQNLLSETYSLMNEGNNYSKIDTLYSRLMLFQGECIQHQGSEIYETGSDVFKLVEEKNKNKFLKDFVRFLTYRSQGNPKQLKRIFYEFIQPTFIKTKYEIGEKGDEIHVEAGNYICVDALEFGDKEIIRIQFLADVFYNINLKLGNYIVQGDDKMATAVFYLTDFIMKFHDLAFSWRHLYRLDELAHIHRLPGLHKVFQSIVHQFTGLYLHKVLNGIFTFRFRSDISKELTYLSKISDDDSAAFNFTLDESGDLKKIYKRKLQKNEANNIDLVSGLGELYDLDKEFDAARTEYARAIKLLDKNYNRQFSKDRTMPVASILSNGPNALKNSINWGNERLTLMLMLGMTYERDNQPYVALSHYRDARSLARKLVTTYLSLLDAEETVICESYLIITPNLGTIKRKPVNGLTRYNVLKYFNILYQPLFAEAWLIEKIPGGLDTSIGILEKGICQLRESLPYINKMSGNEAISATSYAHSNFLLIASQLHNKTGDLAFLKGNQNDENNLKGYLYRAIYHYSVALHEIRRFIYYRCSTSGIKFNPLKGSKECISISDRPDYVILSLSSNLMDIGESTIAKINIKELLKSLIDNRKEIGGLKTELVTPDSFFKLIDNWVGLPSNKCSEKENNEILFKASENHYIKCGYLFEWIGEWEFFDKDYLKEKGRNSKVEEYYPDILKFDKKNEDIERLFIGLYFSWAGIHYLEKGGYYESASKEYVELSISVSTILWWYLTINKNKGIKKNERLIPLLDFSISCLERAVTLSLRNKYGKVAPHINDEFELETNISRVVNSEFITTAYSLHLLCIENNAYELGVKLDNMFCKWEVHGKKDFYYISANKQIAENVKSINAFDAMLTNTRKWLRSDDILLLKTKINDLYCTDINSGNSIKLHMREATKIIIKNRLKFIVNLAITSEDYHNLKINITSKIDGWDGGQIDDVLTNFIIEKIDFKNDDEFKELFCNQLSVDIDKLQLEVLPRVKSDISNVKFNNFFSIENKNLIKIDNNSILDKYSNELIVIFKVKDIEELCNLFFKGKCSNGNLDVKDNILKIIKSKLNKKVMEVFNDEGEKHILNKMLSLLLNIIENNFINLFQVKLQVLFSKSQNNKLASSFINSLNAVKLYEFTRASGNKNNNEDLITGIINIIEQDNRIELSSCITFLMEQMNNLREKQFHEIITSVDDDLKMKTHIQKKLKNHMLSSRYPILNRLRGLSVLTYSTYMNNYSHLGNKNIQINELKSITSTMLYHNNLYDSPFHFTYLESGLCAYLTYRIIDDCNNGESCVQDKRWYKKITRKHINKSISIHTMGNSFYENINNLYYLYDDFNDRRVHMGHALQMLGASYAQLILDQIDEDY